VADNNINKTNIPLVIGYGNPLRGDDGIGPIVAQQVKMELGKSVNSYVAHGLTPEVAELVSEASRVVFVDARRGMDAGAIDIAELAADETPPEAWSMGHFLSPSQVLALASALYGHCPSASLVTIGGERWDEYQQLSDKLSNAVGRASRAVIRELHRRSGAQPTCA
jgi:hydrogenase maturation protease